MDNLEDLGMRGADRAFIERSGAARGGKRNGREKPGIPAKNTEGCTPGQRGAATPIFVKQDIKRHYSDKRVTVTV